MIYEPLLVCKHITTDLLLLALDELDVGEHAVSLEAFGEFI